MKRPTMRLALYDPTDPEMRPVPVGRLFSDTPYDRAVILATIRKFNRWCHSDPETATTTACLGVFPCKPRRKRATS